MTTQTSMSKQAHTPTPWTDLRVEPWTWRRVVRIETESEMKIVLHALNTHGTLLTQNAALKAALQSFMRCHFDGCNCAQCNEARAALTAADATKGE